MKILLLLVFLAGTGAASAGDVVAKLDLKFLKETDQVVGVLCLGESDEDCIPWAHGYLFEARVRKVIYGELPKQKFLVVFGHHAMYQRDIAGMIGVLSKLTDGTDGAEYQIVEPAYSGNLACFDWSGGDDEIDGELPSSGKLMRCFDRDDSTNLPPGPAAPTGKELEDELRAISQAYDHAVVAADAKALDRILGKEFVYASSGGEAVERAARLELLGSGALGFESGVGSDERIHVYGNTGVVSCRFDAKGKRNGQPFALAERHILLWVRRSGRWQLVSEQATLIH